ncbi:hypothetical protein EIN_168620 [Entamoeba invadens IP1]|uniref:Uncharacterized protein n=1 Tax=Entamoeba invadens IP1 TaxID=370355 RepID=A0A0A1TVL2_ENTIV|nr:hypothetical protein EIN_168620 [Entamoeba invadens IP1]ELP84467.1 hypothetical protein EIN_168620 [Entamoeba invadens IP1]|eukprot:XP_004183813.1 hypothetical protein EIN_168620 [Entamoeba invadens IP1]
MEEYLKSIERRHTHGIPIFRYLTCFVLSNLPLLFLAYYAITLVVSKTMGEYSTFVARQKYSLTNKPPMDPQTITIVTGILISILSVIWPTHTKISISLPKLHLLMTSYIFYSFMKIVIKSLSYVLLDSTTSAYHASFKSVSSFSFASTFYFLTFSNILASSDHQTFDASKMFVCENKSAINAINSQTEINGYYVNYYLQGLEYPPSPFSVFYQAVGPFSSRFSKCCERMVFGLRCRYHFVMYHLLLLFMLCVIFTTNDMYENGNHTLKQVIYGVLIAYIAVFLKDLLHFYCRDCFFDSMAVNGLFLFAFHVTDKHLGIVFGWPHVISVFNGVLAFFLQKKFDTEM